MLYDINVFNYNRTINVIILYIHFFNPISLPQSLCVLYFMLNDLLMFKFYSSFSAEFSLTYRNSCFCFSADANDAGGRGINGRVVCKLGGMLSNISPV